MGLTATKSQISKQIKIVNILYSLLYILPFYIRYNV